MNVAPSRKALVYIVSENENVRNIFANGKVFFATLGYASEVVIQSESLVFQKMQYQQLFQMQLSIFHLQSLLILIRKSRD